MCPLCQAFYAKYPLEMFDGELVHVLDKEEPPTISDPILCAFDDNNKQFQSNNWNCKTMNKLRKASGEHNDNPSFDTFHMRDDDRAASIGLVHIPPYLEADDIQQGYLVMSWYKSRGRTGQAWVLWDDKTPMPLTLKTAQFILEKLTPTT